MEKEKIPSAGGGERVEPIEVYIHVLRGLISYHERMFAPIKLNSLACQKDNCAAVKFSDDVYLAALQEALRLMELEALRVIGEISTVNGN